MKLAFKNWTENIQTAAYNGVCTVIFFTLLTTDYRRELQKNLFSHYTQMSYLDWIGNLSKEMDNKYPGPQDEGIL